MNKTTTTLLLIFVFLLVTSCNQDRKQNTQTEFDGVQIHRYEQALFAIPADSLEEGLHRISDTYRIFIGDNYRSAAALMQMRSYLSDEGVKTAFEASQKQFYDLSSLEKQLTSIFNTIQKENPGWKKPAVYTYISGYDIHSGIFMADTSLVIPIDNYLGENYPDYRKAGIPSYLTSKMTYAMLLPDIVKAIAYIQYPYNSSGQSLVSQMISAGKVLYFAKHYLPDYDPAMVYGYSKPHLEWLNNNEKEIWTFLLQANLLFNTDKTLTSKLMMDAPFTPGLPRESPGMIGHWIGYQIVSSWMNKNSSTSINQLMLMNDHHKLFNESGYKPYGK